MWCIINRNRLCGQQHCNLKQGYKVDNFEEDDRRTPEKVARFNKEIAAFEKKWPDILRDGDPYYNPNLTLKSQDFSLKRI